ncbi:MAG TPA: hypothetical protein VN754_08090 [Candidatus Binataceae bacterium]|nr:hypothetical protein [Candidatus Binataceae bacterium]
MDFNRRKMEADRKARIEKVAAARRTSDAQVLLPELRRYVQGGLLHHRLIVQSDCDPKVASVANAIANRQYKMNKEQSIEAWRIGDWSQYIMLHARPYRLVALRRVLRVCEQTCAPALVSSVWIDYEYPWRHRSKWIAVWQQLPNPRATMNATQCEEFAALPEEFAIYRGFSKRENERGHSGLSWTLDRTKAEWFARRFSMNGAWPCIASGRIRKKDVFAYFGDDRGEKEIVVSPNKVRGMTVTALEPAENDTL